MAYELESHDAQGKLNARMYYAPFKRSHRLLRILAPSSNPMVTSQSTGQVVRGAGWSAVSARYVGGSFRHDLGEVLEVNGSDVLSDMTAGRTMVTVGLYLSDQNMNGKTDLGQAFSTSFQVGTDVYLDATQPAWIEFSWTDATGAQTTLKIPNWPSSNGILSVIFP